MKCLHVLVTFAALAVACANTPANRSLPQFAELPKSKIRVITTTGTHRFKVWIAADDPSRAQGLMNVHELPHRRGMLFLFDRPRLASFWMKDTYLSLDLVFVGHDGVVVNVVHSAKPLTVDPIQSVAPVMGVLELTGGTAQRIGLEPGDKVIHTAFGNHALGVGVASTQHRLVARTPQNATL